MTPRTPKTRTLQLLDGMRFRIGARTRTIDLFSVLGLPMDYAFLHLNASTAALELRPVPGGTPAQVKLPRGGPVPPTPVPNPVKGWNCRVELPAVAAFMGADSEQLPPIMRRMARHMAAMPPRVYPWAMGEARGYPGRSAATQTLWVVHATGQCWIEQDDSPPVTPSKAATAEPVTVLVKLSPTVAAVWMVENGYAELPAALMANMAAVAKVRAAEERGRADEPPPAPASG